MKVKAADSLLESLLLVAQFHEVPADGQQLQREYDPEGRGFDATACVRAARSIGFRARKGRLDFRRAEQWPLPAVAKTGSGGWCVLASYGSGGEGGEGGFGIVHRPGGKPERVEAGRLSGFLSGSVVFLSPRELSSEGARRFDLSWFMPMMVKYRKQIGEVLLASFVVNLLGLALPVVMQVIFDKVLVHGSVDTLWALVAVMILVTLFTVLGGMLRTYLQDHAARRMDVELGSSVFRRLLSLPQAYFESRQVGQTVARLGELETVRAFLTQSVMTALLDFLFVFLYLGLMWYYSSFLTKIVLGSLVLYFLVAYFVAPRLRHRLRRQFESAARQQSLSVETVGSMKMLKVFGMEPRMQARWGRVKAEHAGRAFDSSKMANVGSHLVQGISQFTTVAVIGFGVMEVIGGAMTAGALIAFNMLSGRVAQPMLRLGQLWQEFQEAGLAIDRLGDIMNVAPEQESAGGGEMPRLRGDLEFREVVFTYPDRSQPALRGVSFVVRAGQRIGIAGESGSGKSTLVSLLLRMFLADEGAVLVDGTDVRQVPVPWLRASCGVVLQSNDLLSGTVRDSIAMRHPSIGDEKVFEAARLAGAHDFIVNDLPNGYRTAVSERGASLSGGQRQRIALARTLLGDPSLLIMDEATSALDYESERAILDNLDEICFQRTALIISHRLNVLSGCDLILVMHEGKVVERGTHAGLVEMGGRYARLHRLQHQP